MQSTTLKKSTETIYEIKAPLASFDTIDLDDFDLGHGYSSHSLNVPSPEKCAIELSESHKKENSEEEGVLKWEPESSGSVGQAEAESEIGTSTPTEESFEDDCNAVTSQKVDHQEDSVQKESAEVPIETSDKLNVSTENDSDNDREPSDMIESGNITPTETSTGSKEAYSSENNASAEEIQNNLKQKGRKHKEKVSNVKYQQIENGSDVSDQEKESPLPTVKKKPQHKELDSDSDSTDSDSGYIRRGYISAGKGARKDNIALDSNKTYNIIGDFVDSDTTPYTSPRPRRPTLPPPLSKEESAIKSKRKAYEKRLQRLQVTTNPIERPRSTTPINIYGLEEYVNISSPEKSPHISGNFQKLKITLPHEEGTKGKSPRRSAKIPGNRLSESGESPVFSFSEDLLFTHTKSAILLEDDVSKGFSPKRVLVPPTLSPKVSPRNRPSKLTEVRTSENYMYDPWESNTNVETTHSKKQTKENNTGTAETEDWAVFGSDKEISVDESSTNSNKAEKATSDNSAAGSMESTEPSSKLSDYGIDPLSFPNEEILTVQIDETGDSKTCDIRCEQVETIRSEYSVEPKSTGVMHKDKDEVDCSNNTNSLLTTANTHEEPENVDKDENALKTQGVVIESQTFDETEMSLENVGLAGESGSVKADNSVQSVGLVLDTEEDLGSPVDPVEPDLGTPV